jgi:hypothetical protein
MFSTVRIVHRLAQLAFFAWFVLAVTILASLSAIVWTAR